MNGTLGEDRALHIKSLGARVALASCYENGKGKRTPRAAPEMPNASEEEALVDAADARAGGGGGGLELRLAALEERGRRIEDRVARLESKQERVSAFIDMDAVAYNDVLSDMAVTVKALHLELQTIRDPVDKRLRALEQVLDQQKDQHRSANDVLKKLHAEGTTESDCQVPCAEGTLDDCQIACEQGVGEGIFSGNKPKKQSMPGGVSRNLLSSITGIRVKTGREKLPATSHGPSSQSNPIAVPAQEGCNRNAKRIHRPQQRAMSGQVAPALTDPSPRLVSSWRRGNRSNV